MNIKIQVSDEKIADAVESAGIGYWANCRDERAHWDRKTFTLKVCEVEDGPEKMHRVGKRALARGLAVLAEKYPHHLADLMQEKGDMYTGDALIQCAIFGELKYG
jgi:hypothetical protein